MRASISDAISMAATSPRHLLQALLADEKEKALRHFALREVSFLLCHMRANAPPLCYCQADFRQSAYEVAIAY